MNPTILKGIPAILVSVLVIAGICAIVLLSVEWISQFLRLIDTAIGASITKAESVLITRS